MCSDIFSWAYLTLSILQEINSPRILYIKQRHPYDFYYAPTKIIKIIEMFPTQKYRSNDYIKLGLAWIMCSSGLYLFVYSIHYWTVSRRPRRNPPLVIWACILNLYSGIPRQEIF